MIELVQHSKVGQPKIFEMGHKVRDIEQRVKLAELIKVHAGKLIVVNDHVIRRVIMMARGRWPARQHPAPHLDPTENLSKDGFGLWVSDFQVTLPMAQLT